MPAFVSAPPEMSNSDEKPRKKVLPVDSQRENLSLGEGMTIPVAEMSWDKVLARAGMFVLLRAIGDNDSDTWFF